jgi:hypothetical protein
MARGKVVVTVLDQECAWCAKCRLLHVHVSQMCVWTQGGGGFVDTQGWGWGGFTHTGQSIYSMGLEWMGFLSRVTIVTTLKGLSGEN